MTLIEIHNVIYGPDGRARIPASSERVRVREGRSRPSGASAYRSALPTPTERALMGTIGRPWV